MDNLFLILEWDPGDPDKVRILARIEEKRREWSKLSTGAGPAARLSQANLDRIPEMQRQLQNMDAAALQKLAEEAKQLKKQRKGEAEKKLREKMPLASNKGYLTAQEFRKFTEIFKDTHTEDEIRSHVKVPIRTGDAGEAKPESEVKSMSSSKYKEIREDLTLVGKNDLYDFLSSDVVPCCKRTTSDVLCSRAQEIWSVSQRNANKTSVIEATTRLAGTSKDIFETGRNERRLSYQKSLEEECLKVLDNDIGLMLVRHELPPAAYDNLVREGVSTGATKAQVEKYIWDLAKRKNIVLVKPEKLTVDEEESCLVCAKFNPSDVRFCKHCSAPFAIACPKCGHGSRARDIACVKCGFALGNMILAKPLVQEALALGGQRKFAAALEQLRKAEIYWPGYGDAAEVHRKITASQQKEWKEVEAVRGLLDSGRLMEAEKRLREIEVPEAAAELRARLDRQRGETKDLCRKAATHARARELKAAFQVLQQASALGGDLPEVVALGRSLAPDAPEKAEAVWEGTCIQVMWSAVVSPVPVTYSIGRRDLTRGEAGFEVLEQEVSQKRYLDAGVVPGHAYEYAVTTQRLGVASATRATTQAVLAAAEVEKLRAVPGDGCVQLSWSAPRAATGITVIRREKRSPADAADGISVSGSSRQGLTDSGLCNEVTYGYRVFVTYKDPGGRIVTSTGVTVSATPRHPPEPVTYLEASYQAGQVQLSWNPPSKGYAGVLFVDRGPPPAEGRLMAAADLGVQVSAISAGKALFTPPHAGLLHFTAYSQVADMVLIGPSASILVIEDLQDCSVTVTATEIELAWAWPTGVTQIVIGYDFTPPPSWEAAGFKIGPVKRQRDESRGSFRFRPTEKRNHYLRLAVMLQNNGGESPVSVGVLLCARLEPPKEIRFRITRRLFSRKMFLELFTDAAGFTAPELLVIQNAGTAPRKQGDGEVLCIIPPVTLPEKGSINVPLDSSWLRPGAYLGIAFSDPGDASAFRIMRPEMKHLRLPAKV